MTEFAERPSNLLYRVYGLEGMAKTQDAAITAQALTIAHHDERLGEHGKTVAVLTEQIRQLSDDVSELRTIVKWMITTIVGFAFTIAATGVGLALSVGAHP